MLDAGCDLTAEEFRELLIDSLASMYRDQTIDELLCHPFEASDFTGYVGRRARCRELSNSLILRSLVNRPAGVVQ